MEWIHLLLPIPVISFFVGIGCDLNVVGETDSSSSNNKSQASVIDRMSAVKTDTDNNYGCGLRPAFHISPLKRRELNGLSDDDRDSSDDTGADPDMDRILGGSYATYGEIPWMASLMYNNSHVCGGAILSKFWIVTAAHCFLNRNRTKFKIAVGGHALWYPDRYEGIYLVKSIITHEKYRSMSEKYDIALVKIKASSDGHGILFNDYVQAICLPPSNEDPYPGTELLFSGWGFTSTARVKSTILKKVILPILDYNYCNSLPLFGYSVSPTMFCAGKVNGNSDVCGGDNAGPAARWMRTQPIFRGNWELYTFHGTFFLYGIAVVSTGCTPPNYPAIFTSIPKQKDWIQGTMQRYGIGNEKYIPYYEVGPY